MDPPETDSACAPQPPIAEREAPERGLAMDRVSYIHNSGKCLSTLIIARHHVTYAHAHLGNTRLASSEHHVCFEMATRNRL